ncbi:hypothetical protein [Chitinophaga sp. CF418]|nr:hypothetical protein [Chitinophaga sp. CF418]
MEDVFYLTRGWRNATYILLGALICVFVSLLLYSFFDPFRLELSAYHSS